MQAIRRDPWLLAMAILGLSMSILGVGLRLYWLSFPSKPVFDEVYFPVFAGDYLKGKVFFDVHPPLGKYLIALGIALFGDSHLGGRVVPCLFGIATMPFFGLFARRLTGSAAAGWMVAGFVALDALFLSYSRTSLMDGILFVGIFGALWLSMRMGSRLSIVAPIVVLGLAVAVKWTALATLAPMLWYAWQSGRLKPFLAFLPLAAGVYLLIVVSGQMLQGEPSPIVSAIKWHSAAAHRHITLQEGHPWGSPWWSWPLMGKPVLFLYDVGQDGTIQYMTTLANPLLIWSSTAVVLYSSVYLVIIRIVYKDSVLAHPLLPLIVGYFSAWLPFAAVHRVMFFYHYMPAYGFAILILAFWLAQLWESRRVLAYAACLCIAACGLYMVPLGLGYPKLTKDQVDARTWLPSWLNR